MSDGGHEVVVDLSIEPRWLIVLSDIHFTALRHIRSNAQRDPGIVFQLADLAHSLPGLLLRAEPPFRPSVVVEAVDVLLESTRNWRFAKDDLKAALGRVDADSPWERMSAMIWVG